MNQIYCKMKITLLISILFLSTLISNAQYVDDSYDWYPRQIGIKAGINATTMNSSKNQNTNTSADASAKIGVCAQLSYWIPITQVFRPRIELSFDQLKSAVSYKSILYNTMQSSFDGVTTINYGSIALLPEVIFGKHIQFSIFAGFQISALINANENGLRVISDSAATVISSLTVDGTDNTIAEGVDSGLLTGFGIRTRLSKRILINAESRFRFGTSMVYGIYKPYYWGISAGIVYQL